MSQNGTDVCLPPTLLLVALVIEGYLIWVPYLDFVYYDKQSFHYSVKSHDAFEFYFKQQCKWNQKLYVTILFCFFQLSTYSFLEELR